MFTRRKNLKMQTKHLISEKIAAFYNDIPREVGNEDCTYFNTNYTLKFKDIFIWITKEISVNDFDTLKYEDFLCIYKKLRPIFHQSQCNIEEKIGVHQMNLGWLGSTLLMKAFYGDSYNLNGTQNTEKILLLTSLLEFALGSIFYTLSNLKTPPHLLKDLLSTKELEAFFGRETLIFLRIILGTPKSINLRNIAWHGFPTPRTIPTYYVSTLLTIMHSLGHILEEKQLTIIYRTQINDFTATLALIAKELKPPSTTFCMEKTIIENCDLIQTDYKPFWTQLWCYLESKEYWRFVILILPQIELILRLLYAKLNDYDVSAKLDEYYITMDTIFEPTVPTTDGSANLLLNENTHISSGALQFMFDLFIAPKGPRLRDKVSHGEVVLEALNNEQLCYVLMHLTLNLLTQNELKYPLQHYESQFHLNSLTKNALNDAMRIFQNFMQTFDLKLEDVNLKKCENIVKIFRRAKKEAIFMLLILKITNLLIESLNNFKESIQIRQSLLELHELHTKRRRTFENLLKTLPTFCCCLNLILKCLLNIFVTLQATCDIALINDLDLLQRFLKHTLKIAENFVKYTHKDSNEWIKITGFCTTFDELHKKFYLQWQEVNI